MFTINSYKVKTAMKQKGLDAATLASRAEVGTDFIEQLVEGRGRDARIMDFAPLVRLGKVLEVSPFSLIQNSMLV